MQKFPASLAATLQISPVFGGRCWHTCTVTRPNLPSMEARSSRTTFLRDSCCREAFSASASVLLSQSKKSVSLGPACYMSYEHIYSALALDFRGSRISPCMRLIMRTGPCRQIGTDFLAQLISWRDPSPWVHAYKSIDLELHSCAPTALSIVTAASTDCT